MTIDELTKRYDIQISILHWYDRQKEGEEYIYTDEDI